MYAVGRPHPLRAPSQAFFEQAAGAAGGLVTSAEVMQELLHLHARQGRWETLDAALRLLASIRTHDADLAAAVAAGARGPT